MNMQHGFSSGKRTFAEKDTLFLQIPLWKPPEKKLYLCKLHKIGTRTAATMSPIIAKSAVKVDLFLFPTSYFLFLDSSLAALHDLQFKIILPYLILGLF